MVLCVLGNSKLAVHELFLHVNFTVCLLNSPQSTSVVFVRTFLGSFAMLGYVTCSLTELTYPFIRD